MHWLKDSELLPSAPLSTHTLTSVSLCPPVPIPSLTCPSQRLLTHPQKISLTSNHKKNNAGISFSHLLLETSPRVLRCTSLIQVQYNLLQLSLQSPSTPKFRYINLKITLLCFIIFYLTTYHKIFQNKNQHKCPKFSREVVSPQVIPVNLLQW